MGCRPLLSVGVASLRPASVMQSPANLNYEGHSAASWLILSSNACGIISDLPRQSRKRNQGEVGMLQRRLLGLVVALCLAAPFRASAEDVLVTQYKADPSGAPFAVAIAKGFFKKAGIDITDVISGAGGGASVRAAMASALGYGDVSPAPVLAAIDQGQDLRIVNIGSRLLDLNVSSSCRIRRSSRSMISRARSSASANRNRSAR